MKRAATGRRAAAGRLAPAIRAAAVLCVLVCGAPAPARGSCEGISPAANTALKSVAVVTGLTGRPLFVASPPEDTNRLFIVEQDGQILIHKRGDPPGQVSTFLDIGFRVQASPIRDEMGLLGLAFDPDYAQNGLFYVNYTEGPLAGPWATVVARYSVSGFDPDTADPNSEERLLRFAQPQANHNGGQIQFDPDGYLQIATGDGGGSGDNHGTCGNGQSRATLLGKMLRLDVRSAAPIGLPPDCGGATAAYRIPADNPLADGPGGSCDEIWAYGLRNPWRFAFDPVTHDLYIADVGQNCREEIDFVAGGTGGGRNFGWRSMEGFACFNPGQQTNCNASAITCAGVPTCGDPGLTLPVLEYLHAQGACSVTGGYVYRGCLMPNFAGTYFYGDYCSGFIRSFRMAGGVVTDTRDWTSQIDPGVTLTNSLTSFGVDAEGEIYIVSRTGTVRKILPPFPDLETSGPGASTPFRLGPGGWTWQDLEFATMHPVSAYRVYRGPPRGPFRCVHTSATPSWASGDPTIPATGNVLAYLVVAVSPQGEESSSGSPSVTLLPDPCP